MNELLLLDVLADAAFAAIAAVGFTLVSQPPMKALPYVALLAATGHALRFVLMHNAVGISTASFLAAFVMGLGSVLVTTRLHMPAEFFAFPSLLPMIPGMYAYKTILSLIKFLGDQDVETRLGWLVTVFYNGVTTLFVMCALVIGALIPLYMFDKHSWLRRHIKLRNPMTANKAPLKSTE